MLSRSLVPSQLYEAKISQDAIRSFSVLFTICGPYIEYRMIAVGWLWLPGKLEAELHMGHFSLLCRKMLSIDQ